MQLFAQLLLGLSSGLPLLAIGSTLKAWLTESGLELSTIGFFSLVGLPYTLKFLWAPLFDRYSLPFLGRRRGWIAVLQIILSLLFCTLYFIDPKLHLEQLALIALLIAFFSASQDIVIDALRRDSLSDAQLGFGTALFTNGYRLGMLISGALALLLAESLPWTLVYPIISCAFLLGILGIAIIKEPKIDHLQPSTLKEAVVGPFVDFFSRQNALIILLFILLYKFGDSLASEMITPFLLKTGYSKSAIGSIAKTFGLFATLAGALLGGAAMFRLGIERSLWIFGIFQAVSTISFAFLDLVPPSNAALAAVVAFENLCSGMGGTAYGAYMASLCSKRFSASQFALLTSLMGVPRVVFGSSSGILAEHLGWQGYFIFCAALALPGMILLIKIAPWHSCAKTKAASTLEPS